mmetsp:Transcript_27541/g.62452  ORF Transcript_27541/g.62452 Transcript_27541/m.62452 type:complete len:295 (+) Transcript_27541:164-1048(+)
MDTYRCRLLLSSSREATLPFNAAHSTFNASLPAFTSAHSAFTAVPSASTSATLFITMSRWAAASLLWAPMSLRAALKPHPASTKGQEIFTKEHAAACASQSFNRPVHSQDAGPEEGPALSSCLLRLCWCSSSASVTSLLLPGLSVVPLLPSPLGPAWGQRTLSFSMILIASLAGCWFLLRGARHSGHPFFFSLRHLLTQPWQFICCFAQTCTGSLITSKQMQHFRPSGISCGVTNMSHGYPPSGCWLSCCMALSTDLPAAVLSTCIPRSQSGDPVLFLCRAPTFTECWCWTNIY